MSTTTAHTKYYRLTEAYAERLWQADLSGADWRIWTYLVLIDPFGDGYQKLPSMLDVMQKCNVSKATFYRAIAKFQELGLFDFQASICFRNLSGAKSEGHSNLRDEPQKCESDRKNEVNSSSLDPDSQDCDSAYIDRARIQTIHNYSNYSHSTEGEGAGETSETRSEPEQILPPVDSEKPETAEDHQPPSSATPPSSLAELEARTWGGNLQPWELSPKRFDYDPGFVKFLMASYLPTLFCYKAQAPTIDKAQQWLNSARYNEERKDVAHLQWEKYQKSLQVQEQSACNPYREFRPAVMPEVDPETRNAGIAKFRSLVQGA